MTLLPSDTRRPHRCGGCTERWSGSAVCHCSGCHRTFTGLTAFDYHQTEKGCRDPRAVKKPMRTDGYGRWGWPETEGALRAAPRSPAQSDETEVAQ